MVHRAHFSTGIDIYLGNSKEYNSLNFINVKPSSDIANFSKFKENNINNDTS